MDARLLVARQHAAIYLRTGARQPRFSALTLCIALGAGMLAMIYATEGPNSSYYAGLILLFVGMGVLLPLSAVESAAVCAAICAGFAALPLVTDHVFEWGPFGIRLFFLSAASGLGIASCAFLDRLRLNDFVHQREIESARDLRSMR